MSNWSYYNTYKIHTNHIQQYHCSDGPALISYDGDFMEYWVHGLRHRLDGPATTIKSDGIECWFINGKNVTHEMIEWSKEMGIDLNNLTEDDKILIQIKWENYKGK